MTTRDFRREFYQQNFLNFCNTLRSQLSVAESEANDVYNDFFGLYNLVKKLENKVFSNQFYLNKKERYRCFCKLQKISSAVGQLKGEINIVQQIFYKYTENIEFAMEQWLKTDVGKEWSEIKDEYDGKLF